MVLSLLLGGETSDVTIITCRLTLNLENLSALAPNLSDPVFILAKATAARSGYANAQALMMSNLRAHAKNATHPHAHRMG